MIRCSARPARLLAAAALLPLGALAQQVALPADLATWQCTGVCGSAAADGDIVLPPLGSARYGHLTTANSAALGVSPLQLDGNKTGTETNGSKIVSGLFSATAGQRLGLQFQYVSTDGKAYDDYAWARLVDGQGSLVAWLFTAQSTNSKAGKIIPGRVVGQDDFDPDEAIVDFDAFSFQSKTADGPIDWSPLGGSNGSCWEDNADGCGHTGWLEARHTIAATGSYRLQIGVVNWGDTAYDSGVAFDFAGLQAAAPVPEPTRLALMLAGLAGLAAVARRRVR